MKAHFCKEAQFKNFKNKAYSIEWMVSKPYFKPFFEVDIKLFDETNWFMFYAKFLSIGFNLSWSKKSDHSGLWFEINLIGFNFYAQIYDVRHWDDENDKWFVYDEKL